MAVNLYNEQLLKIDYDLISQIMIVDEYDLYANPCETSFANSFLVGIDFLTIQSIHRQCSPNHQPLILLFDNYG